MLRDLQGEELTRRYSEILDQLSRFSGIVGTTFLKAQNEIQGEAPAPRRPDRWRDLARARRRRQRIDLRGTVGAERAGGEVERRAIFHAARADRRDDERGRSGTARDHPRSRLRNGQVSARDLGVHAEKPLARNAEVYTAMRSRFFGIDIVPEVVRLRAMNLYLHDIAGRESPSRRAARCWAPAIRASM